MPNTLSFETIIDDFDGFLVQPLVDGTPFRDFCRMPAHAINASEILHRYTETVYDLPIRPYTDEALVLVCGCGEPECGNNSVTMTADDTIVTWSNLKTHPERSNKPETELTPLTFDRAQYESTLRDIHAAYLEYCKAQLKVILLPFEQSHLDPTTRADPDAMATLLHPQFTEIGASGRTYTRDETLALLQSEQAIPSYTITDFTAHPLPDADGRCDLVRTQYTMTATHPDATQRQSRRTTIWQNDRFDRRIWQMLFHQGTPLSEA